LWLSGMMGTEGYVDRGLDPAGALFELPPKGYGLPWNGFAPSFISKETGGRFQLPKVPSNNDSNLSRSVSSESLSDGFRCL